MGQLAHAKEEYRELLMRLDAGRVGMPEPNEPEARAGWQEILYSPEEAFIAARVPVLPATLETVAARVDMPPETLRPRLEAMAEKGLVMDLVDPRTGAARWLLSPPVVGFFEYSMMRAHDPIPKRRMAEALEACTHGDDTFAREVFGGDTVIGRAMVHETAPTPARATGSRWRAQRRGRACRPPPSSAWCGWRSSAESWPTCRSTWGRAAGAAS